MSNLFSKFFYFIISIIIFIFFLFTSIFSTLNINIVDFSYDSNFSEFELSNDFIWPVPGFTNISSPFGFRKSPTLGASTFHSGIDIPAPELTSIYAVCDMTVYFSGWGAGGGYTISVNVNNHLKISYCHVHPNFLPKSGSSFKKGELITKVGPKNVYGINNNPYKDSNGKPTNGAMTGCHLHITFKENGKAVNPLNYLKK